MNNLLFLVLLMQLATKTANVTMLTLNLYARQEMFNTFLRVMPGALAARCRYKII